MSNLINEHDATQDGCHKMKVWKWILTFIIGSFVMLIAMSMAESVSYILLKDYHILNFVFCMIAGCGLLGLYALWIFIVERRKVFELTLSSLPRNLVWGMAVGVLMFSVLTAILYFLGCYEVKSFGCQIWPWLAQFGFFFVVAVGEEIVFRGFIFRMIDQRFNTWIALLLSALLFGFVHYTNPNGTIWSSTAIAIEAGLMLAMAYKCTNSLYFPIGIHWTWNFTQGNVFGFAVSGAEVPVSLITPTVTGNELLTGGEFGPEASVNAAVLGLLLALWFYKIYRDKQLVI